MSRRLILVGRKKLIWTFVMLLGVILPLLVVSYRMPVEDVVGPVSQMLSYSSEKEGFSFKYPQGWFLRSEKNYSGGEIMESVDFSNTEQLAHGFVQVMHLSKTIPEYIKETRENMAQNYDSLQFKETTVNGNKGYMLAYRHGTGEKRLVGAEYFFPKNEKVYRFSCFYPESQAEQYVKIFGEMLKSFTF